MTMVLVLVRVTAAALARLQAEPKLLDALYDLEPLAPELGVGDADMYRLDYREAADYCEARGLADYANDDDGVQRDLGADGTFDVGFDVAFSISRDSEARTSSVLAERDPALQAWLASGDALVGAIVWDGPRFACACCGNHTLEDQPFMICPVCFWQDDTPEDEPERLSGANRITLREARENYRAFGACDRRSLSRVRPPRTSELPPDQLVN